jgi:hypothetical protein
MSQKIVLRPESKRREQAGIAYGLAVRRYELKPYPGRIAVIANEEWCKANVAAGWPASGGVEVYSIPGTHDTYLRDHCKMVADVLSMCLHRFEGKSRPPS